MYRQMQTPRAPPRSSSAFQVGIICALPSEAGRVIDFFDHTWDETDVRYRRSSTDNNTYTTGCIGPHNVVLTHLPSMGKTSAASVATEFRASFPAIQLALVVGICGAVPHKADGGEIILGDVIVGHDVIQYDFGRQLPSSFHMKDGRMDSLGRSDPRIRSFFNKLMTPTYTSKLQDRATQHLALLNMNPSKNSAIYPGVTQDCLFQSSYRHQHQHNVQCASCDRGHDCDLAQESTCDELQCDKRWLVSRQRLTASEGRHLPQPAVHFGAFASADRVMKSGQHRDELAAMYNIIAFEMEGAGVWDSLPCVVIKGACDYADSHKNKLWQDYSAATAAAYMKAFLEQWPCAEALPVSWEVPRDTVSTQGNLRERQDKLLQSLPIVRQAAFNHIEQSRQPVCLTRTRTSVNHRIMEWAKGNDSRVLFWLCGMAGTGKSTIARTIARALDDENCLAGSFFFSQGGGDLANSRKFVTTIAFQLAQLPISGLKDRICEAIRKYPDITDKGMLDQWKHLIIEPLSQIRSSLISRPLVFIVDALDECSSDDIEQLVHTLAIRGPSPSVNIRVLVSSRPESSVQFEILQISDFKRQELFLQNIAREEVDSDIKLYMTREMKGAKIPISEWEINLLVERASGLFIWASTVCNFVKKGKHLARLRIQNILQNRSSVNSPEQELDKIYTSVLSSLINDEYLDVELHDLYTDLRYILGSIVALFSPLPCDAFSMLLSLTPEEVQEKLQGLQSILEIPQSATQPIRLIHPSFRDYICCQRRCQIEALTVDLAQTHRKLAHQCLRSMSNALRRDICYLQNPGVLISEVNSRRVQEFLPPHVQYACLYWYRHLQIAGVEDEDLPLIGNFLVRHVLHWLEALSLIGKSSEAIVAVAFLQSCIAISQNDPSLYSLLWDTRRFILHHRSMIAEAPLQLYCSGLIFSPESSRITSLFRNHIPPWVVQLPKMQEDWSQCEQTLEGHTKPVSSVAFSSNGTMIASGSQDCNVHVWDATTGQVKHTLKDRGCISSIAISGDQRLVAFASMVGTILISTLGTSKVRELRGVCGWARSIAFSSDSTLLAAGLQDNLVVIWNVINGQICFSSKAHTAPVTCVAFSPQQPVVASASEDTKISIWDLHRDESNRILTGHTGEVTSASFSPDGTKLVSGSEDCTVRIWNAYDGTCTLLPHYHSSSVTCVAFGPDGRHVVSGSEDYSVVVWDIAQNTIQHILRLHSGWVFGVAFAPDGKKVASGSFDTTVRIWDITRKGAHHELSSRSKSVTAVALSRDASRIVSGSENCELQLWDSRTGRALRSLKGHSGWISAVTFGPDGHTIISGSVDCTIRIWNPYSGQHRTLYGHVAAIRDLVCLPDGRVASRSDDGTIRTWDCSAGVRLEIYDDISGSPQSQIFTSSFAGSWAVDRAGRWITHNGRRLLYLPVELRPGGFTSSANTVVLGGKTGQVVAIHLDPVSSYLI